MRRGRQWLAATAAAILVTVTGIPAYAAGPVPGGRILYLKLDDAMAGSSTIRSVRPNGHDVQDTGYDVVYYASPDYSPDGSRITFIEEFGFWTMAADGTGAAQLVQAAIGPSYPRWSPDGQSIIGESAGDIWRARTNGQAPVFSDLTGAHDDVNDLVPSWAPQGHRFATTTFHDVRIYNQDGSKTLKIIPFEGAYRQDWNPKHDQLAVEALGDLWLVDIKSGAITRLTNTPNIQELSPVWSPDGKWIAYGRGPGAYNPDVTGQGIKPIIWLMEASGGHRHSIGINGLPSSWRAAG